MHSYPQARQQAQQIADSGDLPAARALLARAVEDGRAGLASGDPELLETMRQLAGLHATLGDPTAARRLLEEAYAAGRGGPGEPLMVLLAYDLAVVADELANRLVARKNFALVAQYGPAALGAGHPAVAHAREYGADGVAAALPEPPTAPLPVVVTPPVTGPPVTPVHGTPVPVSGMPASGAPVSASPVVSAAPVSGTPVSGSPMAGQPASGAPGFGQPVSGSPAFGRPVSGSPDFGQTAPVSGSPVSASPFGAPATRPRTHVPWLIAAATAAVVAVIAVTAILIRPDAAPGPAPVAAGTTPSATEPLGAGAFATGSPDASPSPSPSSAAPSTRAPSSSPAKPPATTAAAPPAAGVTSISAPRNGTDVGRTFTVKFTVSAADAAATGTRLALTVCVSEWCFLEGPITVENGRARDYPVQLGGTEGEGVNQRWTVRVDRLSNADYDYLVAHKRSATESGKWGNGVSTPIDRLNKTPVSSVVVTKTS